MIQDNKVEQVSEFEPSALIEYGEARERTQGGGGPAQRQDGNQYNS
jgi:hypothetical protein